MATTLTFNMNQISDVSPDPLSFMQGFLHGFADRRGGKGGKEYLRGRTLGRRVKAGEEEMPVWAHPAIREHNA